MWRWLRSRDGGRHAGRGRARAAVAPGASGKGILDADGAGQPGVRKPRADGLPTWDSMAAHVHGTAEVIGRGPEPDALLARLTDAFEAGAWRLADQPETYRQGMLKGLVGVRVRIERTTVSRKLRQNRSPADRRGVVEGLRARGLPGDREIADMVAGTLREAG